MDEAEVKAKIEAELQRHFRPEFFNRIDDVIVFHRLSREEIGEIVEIQLRNLARTVADRGVKLTWSTGAKQALAARGYDPTYGARPLKRLIQKEVTDGLAQKILKNEIAAGDTAEVTASPGGGPVEIHKVSSKNNVLV